MINNVPRTRFAPSPTGYLHVGGLRTALYNYLFARRNGGKFILRIEDTDRSRYVEGAVENLIDTLQWVGLDYDEGPGKPGNSGPYIQSERLDIYKGYVNELIQNEKAYYCFCTTERLQALREEQQKLKLPQAKYDKHCLHLTKDEIEQRVKNNEPYVIRLNVEPGHTISIDDVIRGKVDFSSDVVDDQVLIKSDGFPTYHFAVVVDDHLMKITHVIRGEEWLSSTPKHVLLYNHFGWELPVFAHLPLLLNPDKSKLSKRQGDVAVEDYRSKGYLKDALINFVSLLGWNAGDDREFYKIDELIENFSLERVNKSGAVFNLEKLNWLNGEHLRAMSGEQLLPLLKEELKLSQYDETKYSDDYLLKIIESMRERVLFVKEFINNCPYFYERPKEYDQSLIDKRWTSESAELLNKFSVGVASMEKESKEEYEIVLKKIAEENNVGVGKLIHPVRLSLSGVGTGPGMYDLLFILGKQEVLLRIEYAIKNIKHT